MWQRLYLENIFPFHYHYAIRSIKFFLVFLCNMPITRVSIDNFPISYKATIEMLHFDAQNFGENIYFNNYELNSDWILPPLCKKFTPELKTIPFRF